METQTLASPAAPAQEAAHVAVAPAPAPAHAAPAPAMMHAVAAPSHYAMASEEPPVGAQLRSDVVIVLEKTPEGAVLKIHGHDQNLAEFHGPQAVGLARQALVDVQRAIVKYAYQTAFVYMEMMARQQERVRLETALRSIDPSLQQLQQELRSLTEY